MSKFNRTALRAATGRGPINATATPTGLTHEGAPGYAHDAKSSLFLLAVSNMVGEDTFYESATDRDRRFVELVHEVAVADPSWLLAFVGWLRGSANMRSASIVAAVEAVRARLASSSTVSADAAVSTVSAVSTVDSVPNRSFVAAVLQRADEPGELLAYWVSRYGRALPKPVKRGVADAVQRLYTEYAMLKYDTDSKGYRFADVIELTHPEPVAPWQGDLFRVALERRHDRAELSFGARLPMLVANAGLRSLAKTDPSVLTDSARVGAAGLTWEDVLSLAGSTVDKASLWSALIPSMGYMALLRNLRNFDEAGLPSASADVVAGRLADPAQVSRSRQFPFRFVSAYDSVTSMRWGTALEAALAESLHNVPSLPGRSLVLVDTSASMTGRGLSKRSTMTPAKVAAVFGVALGLRGEADLWGFADGVFQHPIKRGSSLLRQVDLFVRRTGEVGHGTHIANAIRSTYRGHDRVFVISDMQTMDAGTSAAVPATVPLYGFNLGGYRHTAFDAGAVNRHEFGGLTDATFRMVPLLEAGRQGSWPWAT
jgi:hypothetical protein